MKNYISFILYTNRYNRSKILVSIIFFLLFIGSVFQLVYGFFSIPNKLFFQVVFLSASIKLLYDFVFILINFQKNKYANYTIDIKEIDANNIVPENEYMVDVYKIHHHQNEPITWSTKINAFFQYHANKKLPIVFDNNKSHQIKQFIKNNFKSLIYFLQYSYNVSQLQKKDFFNDVKLCLSRSIDWQDNIYCHAGSYYDTIVTNMAAGKRIIDTKGNIIADYTDFAPFNKTNRIQSITTSTLNNHIGVSTIAITNDNYVVFWVQNSKAQSSSNLIVPTGSGSCDYSDVTDHDFIKTIKRAMERELIEESFSKKYTENIIKHTLITGYFRWINKGAKPEFVGITKLTKNITDLQNNTTEVKNSHRNIEKLTLQYKINNTEHLKHIFTDMLKNEYLSVPLRFNINTVITLIEKNPVLLTAFLKSA